MPALRGAKSSRLLLNIAYTSSAVSESSPMRSTHSVSSSSEYIQSNRADDFSAFMFQVFTLQGGVTGVVKEYWNRYLLHNELPVGVVSGPGNVFPREWQRAWRACYAGDNKLMAVYKAPFEQFESACKFEQRGGSSANKMIACLKEALRIEGVIESASVAAGTPSLTRDEAEVFAQRYRRLKELLAGSTDPTWISRRLPSV